MPDSMEYFISRDNITKGPLSPREVIKQLEGKGIAPTDLAWHESADGWMPVSSLPFVAVHFKKSFPFSAIAIWTGILLLFGSLFLLSGTSHQVSGIWLVTLFPLSLVLLLGGMFSYLVGRMIKWRRIPRNAKEAAANRFWLWFMIAVILGSVLWFGIQISMIAFNCFK